MRPQDIERIADSVMGAFIRPTRASAGCGDVSSTQSFSCPDFGCGFGEPSYECGGAADFKCTGFGCSPTALFGCDDLFSCSAGYAYTTTTTTTFPSTTTSFPVDG